MSLLPEMVRLSEVAKALDVHGHTLVEASQRGQFVRLVRIGETWYAPLIEVQEWFSRNHAAPVSLVSRAKRAARQAASDRQPASPRRRARGSSAASS